MNKPGRLAALAVTAVAAGGLGVGSAFAQPSHSSHAAATRPAAAEPTAPDTDNVQEGDQTTPDTPAATRVGTANRPAVHVVSANKAAATRIVSKAAPAQPGDESENPGESEGSDQSDGPGGHQDPAGDVQHEGDASEQ